MKLCRKVVAFVLSLVIVFTLPLSAGALDKDAVGAFFHKGFYNTAETLVEGLLGAIASLFPAPRNWKAPDDAALTKHMRGTAAENPEMDGDEQEDDGEYDEHGNPQGR